MDRDPCPQRLWTDIGGAFAMGGVAGSVWHAVKGARNSPNGQRVAGSLVAVRTRAPAMGGQFAVWGGLFSTFDCLLEHGRGKADVLNPVISGAVTGTVLAARSGWKSASRAGLFGGAILVLIEGVAYMLTGSQTAPAPIPPPARFPGLIPVPTESVAEEVQRRQDFARGGFGSADGFVDDEPGDMY